MRLPLTLMAACSMPRDRFADLGVHDPGGATAASLVEPREDGTVVLAVDHVSGFAVGGPPVMLKGTDADGRYDVVEVLYSPPRLVLRIRVEGRLPSAPAPVAKTSMAVPDRTKRRRARKADAARRALDLAAWLPPTLADAVDGCVDTRSDDPRPGCRP